VGEAGNHHETEHRDDDRNDDRSDLRSTFQQRNALGRGDWERYAAHRRHVTERLLDIAVGAAGTTPTARVQQLCLLGAGNANDVDLPRLLERFERLLLVDLDADALQSGVARQRLEAEPRVATRALDVTGNADLLTQLSPALPLDDLRLRACREQTAAGPPGELGGPFDVVASLCLMTQLIDSVLLTLGERHPAAIDLLMGIRNQHLRQLIELTRPGGTALLVTDVVSSASHPPLAHATEAELPGLVARLINERNFFTGANPFALRAFFQTDSRIAPWVEHVELTNPWLWDFGPRVYAVCALVVRRR